VSKQFTFHGPNGQTIVLNGPDTATREEAIAMFRQQHPELYAPKTDIGGAVRETSGAATQFVRGVGRGLVGDVVGAGQFVGNLGETIAPDATRAIGKRVPSWLSDAARQARDFSTAEPEGIAESAGSWIGSSLPFLAFPEATGGRAAKLLYDAGQGAVAGIVQPTRHGTAEGREENAKLGMLGGAAGGTLADIASRAGGRRLLGLLAAMAAHGAHWPIYHTISHGAGHAAATAASRIPPAAAGAGAAELLGEDD
jgi:hypothetical protein